MPGFDIQRHIAAPQEEVFKIFTDFEGAAEHIESIRHIELLTPGPVQKGSRFRETRAIMGKSASEEMVVTSFDPPHGYTVECTSHGMHFVSEFRLRPSGAGTDMDVRFDAHPKTTMARLMGRMMLGTMHKLIERDIDTLAQVIGQREKPAGA